MNYKRPRQAKEGSRPEHKKRARNELEFTGRMLSGGFDPAILSQYSFSVFEGEPYDNCWRLNTDRGQKALYKYQFGQERVLRIHHYLENLSKKGFRRTSRFIPARNGEPIVQIDNDIYVVADWLPGRNAEFSNDADVKKAAYNLGEFHQLSRGCGVKEGQSWSSGLTILQGQSQDLLRFREIAARKKNQSPFDQLYLEHVATFYGTSQKAVNDLEQFGIDDVLLTGIKEGCICHGNWGEKNLLVTRGPRMGVLGWEKASVNAPVLDLTNFLTKVGWKREWQCKPLLKEAVVSYNSAKNLNNNEKKVLVGLLTFPRNFWLYAARYYLEPNRWPKDKLWEGLHRSIDSEGNRLSFAEEMSNNLGG